MKPFLISVIILFLSVWGSSQNSKMIQRSWIKIKIENLSNREITPDTIYTRYTFTRPKLYIGLYPGWDDYQQTWSLNGNNLTIGFDTYTIEELTDTSLTFSLTGFRRVRLLSEEYCSSFDKYLVQIGEFNGKPLFEANRYVSPRYKNHASFRKKMDESVKEYSIPNASYFRATFVITEEGKVENVQVINSILEGFDLAVINQIKKTSKDWKPALFRGKPVQTQMSYDIRYLKSTVPYKSGKIN